MDTLLHEALREALAPQFEMLEIVSADDRPSLAGVIYAEDFDAPVEMPAPQPPAPPPEPMISAVEHAAELAAARAAGREEGLEAARGEIATVQGELRLAALQAIADGLGAARGAAARIAQVNAEAVAGTLLATLAAALPALCARHAEAELRAVIEAVLPLLGSEPQVSVRCHPDMVQFLRGEIDQLDPDLASRVTIAPSEQMQAGDIRIGWHDGCAVRDTRAITAAIRAALPPLSDLALTETANVERD